MKAEEILKKCGLTREDVIRLVNQKKESAEAKYSRITPINTEAQVETATRHMSYGVRFGSDWNPITTYGG